MRILITDPLSSAANEILRGAGHDVVVRHGLNGPALVAEIAGAEVLLVRGATKVTREVLTAATQLRIVGRAGAGVDNIDVDAASALGILVMNAPGGNSIAVAEHTVALMLSAARHIVQANRQLVGGTWDRKTWMGMELTGKTLGVIGFGQIGREVSKRAIGLGMSVMAFDPLVPPGSIKAVGAGAGTLEEVLKTSDVVTIHVPLMAATRHMISKRELAFCRDGIVFVNCSRGGVIDETALLEALDSGRIAAAGIDVFEDEPPAGNHPLIQHPRVIATPHIGAATVESQERVATIIARQVCVALGGGEYVGGVNTTSATRLRQG